MTYITTMNTVYQMHVADSVTYWRHKYKWK